MDTTAVIPLPTLTTENYMQWRDGILAYAEEHATFTPIYSKETSSPRTPGQHNSIEYKSYKNAY